MADDQGTGEIIETERSSGKLTFEWRIPNFFRSIEEVAEDYFCEEFGEPDFFQYGEVPKNYTSPPFNFCNECWTLNFKRGIELDPKSGLRMDLNFFRYKDCPPRTIYYTFAIKALNGVEQKIEGDQEFGENGEEFGWPDFWLLPDLIKYKSRLVPGNVFTIIGVFKSDEPTISLFNRHWSVISNQKSLLTERSSPDFTLKIGNHEWPVHKHILASRSEYFASMFRHEWSENTEGEVRFDDMKEDTMNNVLKFIYCDEVTDVPVERMCDIYIDAHKFVLEDMKALCIKTMKENMGPDTVWKSLAIAKIYEEKDLEKSAFQYLAEDDAIKNLCMKDWKRFEQNYPSIAAEVLKEISDDWDDESDVSDMDESHESDSDDSGKK